MEAKIETSKSGQKILIVYYQGNGFNEAIEQAERRFDVVDDASVTVIALPVSIYNDTREIRITSEQKSQTELVA